VLLLKTLLLLNSDAWRLLADAYHELDSVEAAAVAAVAEAAVVVEDSANVDVETLRRKWVLVVLR
jgi:hypothetical protein